MTPRRLGLLSGPAALTVLLVFLSGTGWTQSAFTDARTGSIEVAAAEVSAPSGLTAQVDANGVHLSWSAATATTEPIEYDVCRSVDSTCPAGESIGTTDALQLTDSNPPTTDGTYYYAVRARAGGWLSEPSNIIECTVAGGQIACPN